jgi:integration host factor subunit alpha
MSLTKDKLADRIKTQLSLNRKESLVLLESLLKVMKDTLSQGEDLLISGFGKFSVRPKKGNGGRNPRSNEDLVTGPRKILVFRSSGVLRQRLNQNESLPGPPHSSTLHTR